MPPAKKSAETVQRPISTGKTMEAAKPIAADIKSAPQAVPKDALDSVIGLISPTFNFVRANFKSLLIKLLKVELAAMLVGLALWIVFGLIMAGILAAAGAPLSSISALAGYVMANRLLLALAAILFLVADLAISWVSSSISFTSCSIVKEQFEGAYSGIWSLSGKIRMRVLGYILLNFVIMAVFLGIPALLVFLLLGHPGLLIIALVLFVVYAAAFMLVYMFISQFWRWELTVGEKQAYEALGASISLAKENIVAVFVYDIVSALGYIAVAIPFLVVMLVVDLIFQALGLGAAYLSPLAYLVVVAVSALVRTLITIVDASVSSTFMVPYAYSFWDGLRKKA